MYSMVLMVAMTPAGDVASFGKRGGCNGCDGYAAGCNGGGFLGGKHKSNGCSGYSHGCSGYAYAGSGYSLGCTGAVAVAPVAPVVAAPVVSYGCSGVVASYGCHGSTHAYGCSGGCSGRGGLFGRHKNKGNGCHGAYYGCSGYSHGYAAYSHGCSGYSHGYAGHISSGYGCGAVIGAPVADAPVIVGPAAGTVSPMPAPMVK